MWNFRSIKEYQKFLQQYPIVEEKLNEAKAAWQLSYTSKDGVYYMFALMLGFVIMSLTWVKDVCDDVFLYRNQRHLLELKLQEKPTIGLEVSAKRLFGSPIVEQGTLSVTYTLQGILYDEVPEHRQVILKDEYDNIGSYYIGEDLPQGGRVTAIDKDSVEIEDDGIRQSIKLTEYPASFLSKQPLDDKKSIFDDAN